MYAHLQHYVNVKTCNSVRILTFTGVQVIECKLVLCSQMFDKVTVCNLPLKFELLKLIHVFFYKKICTRPTRFQASSTPDFIKTSMFINLVN